MTEYLHSKPSLTIHAGEGPEDDGVARDVVTPVCLQPVVYPDIMEARQEVESVPGTISGRLLARTNLHKVLLRTLYVAETV